MRKMSLSLWAVVLLGAAGSSRAGGADVAPFARKLPTGWRDLQFGMSEDAAKQVIAKYRGPKAKIWEKTPLTYFVLVDPAGGRISKINVDANRIHHWTINDLDEGTATVRAWFDDGKLIAVNVLSTLGRDAYVGKAGQVFDAEPKKLRLLLADESSWSKPPPRDVDVAFWRGNGATAIVFQPTGWGPELFIASDSALDAVRKLHERDPNGTGASSDKSTPSAKADSTHF